MKTKDVVLYIAVVVLIVAVAFLYFIKPVAPVAKTVCADPANCTARELQNGVPFRLTGTDLTGYFRMMFADGFMSACKDLDVLCVDSGIPGTGDEAYLQSIEQSDSLGNTGLVVTGYDAYQAASEKLAEKGTPIVTVHALDRTWAGLTAWVGPTAYGAQAGDAMAAKTNCASPMQTFMSGHNVAEDKAWMDFEAEYKVKCPDAVMLPVQEMGLEQINQIAKVSAVLQANPDIKGIYGTTGGAAVAIATALEQLGIPPGEKTVISMDPFPFNLDTIKSGYTYMLVYQPVYWQTYKAVEILTAKIKGEPYNLSNPIPSILITAENYEKYYTEK
jgi:ABC-type sugar transport system substrate-binding protein